jgi:hypothetical protein
MPPSRSVTHQPPLRFAFCCGVSTKPEYFHGIDDKVLATHYHFNQGLHVWRANCCLGLVPVEAQVKKKIRCVICTTCTSNLSCWKKDQVQKKSTIVGNNQISSAAEIGVRFLAKVVDGDKDSTVELEQQITYLRAKKAEIPRLTCVVKEAVPNLLVQKFLL